MASGGTFMVDPETGEEVMITPPTDHDPKDHITDSQKSADGHTRQSEE